MNGDSKFTPIERVGNRIILLLVFSTGMAWGYGLAREAVKGAPVDDDA